MSEDAPIPAKPSRGFTRLQTHANIVACWIAIAAAIWHGRDMAAIVVPIMATLIAALLGVYQAIGHFDLRALAALSSARPSKTVRPRQRLLPGNGGEARVE